jgi:hypothetical protein
LNEACRRLTVEFALLGWMWSMNNRGFDAQYGCPLPDVFDDAEIQLADSHPCRAQSA